MVDACTSAGILPFYGPYGDIKDTLGCETQFRAAFLLGCVGAWSLHPVQIENLCESITRDPRLPGAKILAATSSRIDPDSLKVCSRAVCASLEKPVPLEQLQACIETLEGKAV